MACKGITSFQIPEVYKSDTVKCALTHSLMHGEPTDEILLRRRGELQNETYNPPYFTGLLTSV
jgi:hypothetical protein